MANVSLSIGGRRYTLGCADGDEPELERLAVILDEQVANARAMIGEAGDARLLVLAGLLLADRAGAAETALVDAAAQVGTLQRRVDAVVNRLSHANSA